MKVQTSLLALATLALGTAAPAEDLLPLTFQMTWKAQAEHGGYYQAVEKGFYADCGLDITIREGGPGVDGLQLLTSGAVDIAVIGQNDGVMRMNEAGFPAKAVMATFQKMPQILMFHAESGIETPEDLAGRPIMISAANRNTFWPFLRARYGLSDDQLRNHTGQLATWIANPDSVQQAFVSNEPFRFKAETGQDANFFMLSELGYPAYSSLVVVPQAMIDATPEAVQCLVDATRKGWADFIADPAPALAEITRRQPDNSPEQMAFSIDKMVSEAILAEGDMAGIGMMTEERWTEHFDKLVEFGLFPADFDLSSAYTLEFLK